MTTDVQQAPVVDQSAAARLHRANEEIALLKKDLALIADCLLEEAISRDWCDEYGGFVDDVNGRTSEPWLRHCEFTYRLRYSVQVDVTIHSNSALNVSEEIKSQLEDLSLEEGSGEMNSVAVALTSTERTE